MNHASFPVVKLTTLRALSDHDMSTRLIHGDALTLLNVYVCCHEAFIVCSPVIALTLLVGSFDP